MRELESFSCQNINGRWRAVRAGSNLENNNPCDMSLLNVIPKASWQDLDENYQAGMTHITDIFLNDDPYNMFGGEKNSGLGHFNTDWIIDEFTKDYWIAVQNTPRIYPF